MEQENKAFDPAEQKMDVLLVRAGCYPETVQIGKGLKALQKAVGGDIEAVFPFEDPVAVIVNEEGKLNGSELNRGLKTKDGELYDILAGDFLVTGLGEEDFASLSPELMQKYEGVFHQPEVFMRLGRSIMAIPIPDENVRKPPEKAEHTAKKAKPERDGR